MRTLFVPALACVFAPCRTFAQTPPATERARLAEITAAAVADSTAGRRTAGILLPSVRLTWNSGIPYSLNDGPMWAGRGLNIATSAGGTVRIRALGTIVRATVAPTLVYSENRPFFIMPGTEQGRSQYSTPFHGSESSLDMPMRFGDRPLLRVDPGNSELSIERWGLTGKLTAANDWWGPGIRNALVMSNHAPGIPRAELSTLRPRTTRIGLVSARLITGTLTESRFFDNQDNDYRSISGAHLTLRPAFDTSLTLGIARVVYRTSKSPYTGPLSHAADVLFRWERVAAPADTTATGLSRQESDQIIALSARWVVPNAGFEAWGEWARMDLPRSLTELLTAAHHTGAWTLGFQWASQRRAADFLRLQSEITYLEQSLVFANRPPPEYYTSVGSPHGFTQRGQIIGAGIGPGGSSQWIALDWIAPDWSAGIFTGRIRWDNDAMYRQIGPSFFRHDVTVLGGLRGALRTRHTDFASDITFAYRYNYLFQHGFANPGGFRTVDVRNVTVSLSATPR